MLTNAAIVGLNSDNSYCTNKNVEIKYCCGNEYMDLQIVHKAQFSLQLLDKLINIPRLGKICSESVTRYLIPPTPSHVVHAHLNARGTAADSLVNFFNPIRQRVCVAAALFSIPTAPTASFRLGRSFKMQTRGLRGFKTPAIPGFRCTAKLGPSRASRTPIYGVADVFLF